MSLPDAPNTLREKYYSVMAGQNSADILPDIETAPSTENRYLDYLARNGGGGSGDVTKDYVDEQDAKKTDKVISAISGNFAGLDASGNLTDSGKKATDFATASDMTAVQGVIPSTATTQNKLATAADTAGEEISNTATGTSITLTDSADGYVQGVTVKGHSEVVDGAIKSIGDAGTWGRVDMGTLTWTYNTTTAGKPPMFIASIVNSVSGSIGVCSKYEFSTYNELSNKKICIVVDTVRICDDTYTDVTTFKSAMSGVLLYYPLADTTGATPTLGITSKDGAGQGTAATITTGLPLRSVSDSTYDTLDNEKVIKKCAEVDMGDLTWTYVSANQMFETTFPIGTIGGRDLVCSDYHCIKTSSWNNMENGDISTHPTEYDIIHVKDVAYTTASTFKTAVTGVKLVYELATPTETPLTSAEKSALASLRTYDHTTYIDATDAPTMTVDYLLNTDNGKAVAGVDNKIIAIKSVSWTGTGTTTNSITFPEKPLMILGYTQDSDYDTYVRGIMPFFFHPSTAMLRVFWKGKSQTSHNMDYTYSSSYVLTIDGNSISWVGLDASQALNSNGVEYTVYYI